MASASIHAMRPGMQVHAVPDSERAFDASGRKLPWGFEYADGSLPENRREVEKGPFGRSMRRRGTSRSRSKTAEPQKKEDAMRHENLAYEDSIFGRVKEERKAKEGGPLQPVDANVGAGIKAVAAVDREPTEVILYGFGADQEWAAIQFYEAVSSGTIYEDYNRIDPNDRYHHNTSFSRATAAKSLSKAALRKKNAFAGGAHWIKVTFDSPEAADLACSRSPHNMRGHLVYAEPYMGKGPANDAPILASNAGAQITSEKLPKSFSTNPMNQASPSSDTVSSATATGPAPSQPDLPRSRTQQLEDPFNAPTQLLQRAHPSYSQLQQRPLRIQGASRAVLLPADQAFAPAEPKWSVSKVLTGTEIFGEIPRKESGEIDWDKAGFYWRFWGWIDSVFGTDWCGLKDEDEASVVEMKKTR